MTSLQAVLISILAIAALQEHDPCDPLVPTASQQACKADTSDIAPRFPPVEVALGPAPGIARGDAAEILEITSLWVDVGDTTAAANAPLESVTAPLSSRLESAFPKLRVNDRSLAPNGFLDVMFDSPDDKATPTDVDVLAMLFVARPSGAVSAQLVFVFHKQCRSREEAIDLLVNTMVEASGLPAVSP